MKKNNYIIKNLLITMVSFIFLFQSVAPIPLDDSVESPFTDTENTLTVDNMNTMWNKIRYLNYVNENVGIGTTTPNHKLHIHNPSDENWIQMTNGNTGIGMGSGAFFGVNTAGTAGMWSDGELRFWTGGTYGNDASYAKMILGIDGTLDMGGSDIINVRYINSTVSAPLEDNHLVTKGYVDSVAGIGASGGSGNAVSCEVICNAACPTPPTGYVLRESSGKSGYTGYISGSGVAGGRCLYTDNNGNEQPGLEKLCCYFAEIV